MRKRDSNGASLLRRVRSRSITVAFLPSGFAGNAGAAACNAGSSGVTKLDIAGLEWIERASAFLGTLAGEGACVPGMAAVSVHSDACRRGRLRSRHGVKIILA